MAKVTWAPSAVEALEEISDFIAMDSRPRAIEFITELMAATRRLEKFPLAGAVCRENMYYRQLVVRGYRVIYKAEESSVKIVGVISPGRQSGEAIPSETAKDEKISRRKKVAKKSVRELTPEVHSAEFFHAVAHRLSNIFR